MSDVTKNERCLAEEIVKTMLTDPTTGICPATDKQIVSVAHAWIRDGQELTKRMLRGIKNAN